MVERTNADRIRKMSDSELAEFIIAVSDGVTQISVCDQECSECSSDTAACEELCLRWLREEVQE